MEKRIISILLIVSMLFGLCACGKTASANEMKLVKTEGAARVTDEKQMEQSIRENMNLYNGYGVGTEERSFAWINLDFVKLLKLNESSNAVLEKDGRKLKVVLQSGDMFFCVLEELEKDESLTLETGNMSMAIRGTCGIVRVLSDRESQLVLLEGKVTVTDTAGMVRQDVETGQVLNLYVEDDGTANLTLREIRSDDILDFAREYIDEDTRIQKKIEDGGGTVDFLEEDALEDALHTHSAVQMPDVEGAEVYYEMIQFAMDFLAGKDVDDIRFKEPFYAVSNSLHSRAESNIYAIYDVNYDGAPELLLGYKGDGIYGEGTYIQGCWTTNGEEPLLVLRSNDYHTIALTSNGYIVEQSPPRINDIHSAGKWTFYSISTEPIPKPELKTQFQYYEYLAHATYSQLAGSPWTIADDGVIRANVSDEEFQAFVNERYPILPMEALDWRPLT